MSTYKHLADLLKICSVLPALAIMPAMAENAQYSNPTDVESWIENTYDVDDDTSRNGGVLKVESGKEIDAINAGTVSGNTVNLIKTESSSGEIYGQGSVLYNNGSIGAITGTFENNSVVNTSDTVNKGKATVNGGAFALYGGTNIGSITGDFTGNSAIAKYAGEGETSYTSGDQISAGGGAMHIQGAFGEGPVTIGRIEGNFTGNSAHGDGYANGGALYIKAGANDREGVDKYGVQIDEIVGNFDGNFAVATTGTNDNKKDSTGGAISIKEDGEYSVVANINGNFTNNYVSTNSTNALGGAIYNEGTLTVNGDFIANKAISESGKAYGGAIYNTGDATVSGLYSENSAISGGGAIYNTGNMTIKSGSTFSKNEAASGGAIYNAGNMTLEDGVQITENTGAVYNNGTLNIGNNVAFIGNTDKYALRVNGGSATVGDNARFISNSGNSATVYVGGGTVSIGENAVFENNVSTGMQGGGIYTSTTTGLSIGNGALFSGNKVEADKGAGGALYLKAKDFTLGDNFTFADNSADLYGGAIYYDVYKGNDNLAINGYTFTGNKVTGDLGYGGALAISNSVSGTVDIKNSLFEGNTATTAGGAIANDTDSSVVVTIDGTTFNMNQAVSEGGAIAVDKDMTISNSAFSGNMTTGTKTFDQIEEGTQSFYADNGGGAIMMYDTANVQVKDSLFANNSSKTYGGAIATRFGASSEESSLKINNATFVNNVAGVEGGAIYNTVAMTLDGNNTFSGNTANGVANDIHNDGVIDVASGTTTIGSGISGTGSLNIAEGATLNIGTTTVQQDSINLDGTLAAQIVNANSFGKLQISEISVGENGVLDLALGSVGTYDFGTIVPVEKIAYNDAVYNVDFNENNQMIVSTKSVDEIVSNTNLSSNAATTVSVLANVENDLLNTISLRAQQDLAAGNVDRVEAETAKLNPENKPVAQSVATSVQNQVMSLAAGRMSGAPTVGRSGGDLADADYGVWAQGLYNHSKYNGKFTGDTMGISVGVDTLIDGKYTVGIGYAYNDTDVDSDSRDTDIESNSIFVYGQYKPAEWYINAALNYTMSNYKESSDPYGIVYESEYDVNSFGGQVAAGYDFAFGLTPEVGVRYLNVSQDAYESLMGHIDGVDTNYLTGVAGVKYAFEIETDSELSLRPELRAAATYDFLSDSAVATITAPGNLSYVIDADRLSRLGGEFGIGLVGNYKGVEVSLNYDLDLHEDYTSHTGMLKFRYNF